MSLSPIEPRRRAPRSPEPQDLALTIFGGYLREDRGLAWSGGMVELLGEFGFSTEAARAALNRLAIRGLIDRTKEGRRVFYVLSARARTLLHEGDQRIFGFGSAPPEGRWTVLWHSLPDSLRIERARLGRRLRFLGFGSIQDATWIALHDRADEAVAVLSSLGVAEHACVILGEPAQPAAAATVLRQAWDLEQVAERYEAFLESFGRYSDGRTSSELAPREAFVVRTRALHEFRSFPLVDPEPPEELMPRPGLRRQVVDAFEALYEHLREPAERHFADVALAEASEQAPDRVGA